MKDIISTIRENMSVCPLKLESVILFGSATRQHNYRDIDIVFISSAQETKTSLTDWARKHLSSALKVRIDAKCYDYETFLEMIRTKSPLTLSIAVDMKFIIYNPAIDHEFQLLRNNLVAMGVDVRKYRSWDIQQTIIDEILAQENYVLRGFLVSHLEWIKTPHSAAKELLEALTPLEESFTRIACFKQVIKLFSSEDHRLKLNITISDTIHFASRILSNRKSFDFSTFEDYSSNDLCLELIDSLVNYSSDVWINLFFILTKDYNHLVRQKMVEIAYDKVLPANPALGIRLLANLLKDEPKNWIRDNIVQERFVKQGLAAETIKLLITGWLMLHPNTDLDENIKKLHDGLCDYAHYIKEFSVDSFDKEYHTVLLMRLSVLILEVTLSRSRKPSTVEEDLLFKILGNSRLGIHKAVFFAVIQENTLDINLLNQILLQFFNDKPNEIQEGLLFSLERFNNTSPVDIERYTHAVNGYNLLRRAYTSSFNRKKDDVIMLILEQVGFFLKKEIMSMSPILSRLFSVTPKPRFGLKVAKQQSLKLTIKNPFNITIPDVNIEILSSAEIEISQHTKHTKTYKPFEQSEILCSVKPHVAKQIVISYKINENFGDPLYISADRENPFVPHKPASNAHFVGRDKEIQIIREEIHQQHFLIFGPRRIGKTSLLFQLREELSESYVPIYISLQKFISRNGIDLFEEAMSDILIEIAKIEGFSSLETLGSKLTDVKEALKDRKLVLLIDEMDVGQGIDGFSGFLERMRVLMQQETFVRVVFSAGPFITKDLVDPRSPLFNLLSHIPVNRFTSEAAERLLRLAEDQDIIFEGDMISEGLKWTGNLPLYLQILGNNIYQSLKDQDISNRRVSKAIMESIKKQMYNDVVEWERLWHTLSKYEKAILAFYAHHDGILDVRGVRSGVEEISGQKIAISDIKSALTNLAWHGLIETDDQPRLTSQLVHTWAKNQIYYPDEIEELFG